MPDRRFITAEQFDVLAKAATAIPVAGPQAVSAMHAVFAALREIESQRLEAPEQPDLPGLSKRGQKG